MPKYFTIQLGPLSAGNPERSFESVGVQPDFQIERQSKGRSTATFTTAEEFDGAAGPQFKFDDYAIIRAYRNSANGADNSFAGGFIIFQGYFDDPSMTAEPEQRVQYRVHNVWWLFERNLFKQYTMQFAGFSTTNKRVLGMTVSSPGHNYKVGDNLAIVGGVGTPPATAQVAGVNQTGGVTLAVLTNGGGVYPNAGTPPLPAPTTTDSVSGSGCAFNLVFQASPILVKKVISEVYLGEDLHAAGGYTTPWPNGNGDQVGEVIDWMNETYNPTRRGSGGGDATRDVVQRGRLDPRTKMPIDRTNTVFCSEAINKCLRWDPDAVVVEDPTEIPPVLSVFKLAKWNYATIPPTFVDYTNLQEVVVDISADVERRILLQGQLSRVIPGVIIYYVASNQVDGAFVNSQVVDKYPPDISDYIPEVSSHTIQLLGSQLTHLVAVVAVETTYPFSLLFGSPAAQVLWWQGHDKSLGDSAVLQSSITPAGPVVITDTNGNPIDTTVFSNELKSDLPSWTGEAWVEAVIRQPLSFKRYLDADHKVLDAEPKGRVHTKTVKLTTASGQLYTKVASVAEAEVPPQNVAESVYRSMSAVQYAGTITVLSNPIRTDIAIGTRLKLVGPTRTFENLMVQRVVQVPGRNEVTVTFGPGPEVDIDLWVELARASRYRITWELPSTRGDGGSGLGGSSVNVDSSANSPTDDTSHSVGGFKTFGASFQQP